MGSFFRFSWLWPIATSVFPSNGGTARDAKLIILDRVPTPPPSKALLFLAIPGPTHSMIRHHQAPPVSMKSALSRTMNRSVTSPVYRGAPSINPFLTTILRHDQPSVVANFQGTPDTQPMCATMVNPSVVPWWTMTPSANPLRIHRSLSSWAVHHLTTERAYAEHQASAGGSSMMVNANQL